MRVISCRLPAKVHYFGADGGLLGTLHRPTRLRARSAAVLLCNPFGEEAARAHRIYRVLATQLERAGYACLRFDYGHTGDSAGDGDAATLAGWVDDVRVAEAALREASGSPRVVLVGLRLGATIAALAAAAGVAARHLILWDPVLDGRTYLDELARVHAAYMREELGAAGGPPPRRADGTPREALGAPISDTLAAELAAVALARVTPRAELITLVSTNPAAPSPWPGAHRVEIAASAAWNSDAALNAATVPMEIVTAIVGRIESTVP